MVKCGSCKKHHATTAEVRECYARAGRFTESGLEKVTGGPQWPASDKQKAYVLGLQDERVLPAYWQPMDRAQLDLMERDEVNGIIVMLKSFTYKEQKPPVTPDIEPGRYALHDGDRWHFYEVTKGKGRWEGYTFTKRLIGSPGDYQKANMGRPERERVNETIAKDAKQAMLDYGLHSGVCGKCSSPLTDPDSLARGIGPVCARKMGW